MFVKVCGRTRLFSCLCRAVPPKQSRTSTTKYFSDLFLSTTGAGIRSSTSNLRFLAMPTTQSLQFTRVQPSEQKTQHFVTLILIFYSTTNLSSLCPFPIPATWATGIYSDESLILGVSRSKLYLC